jgi:hypothetical protein
MAASLQSDWQVKIKHQGYGKTYGQDALLPSMDRHYLPLVSPGIPIQWELLTLTDFFRPVYIDISVSTYFYSFI